MAREYASAIYRGWVRHRRFAPTSHEFCYQVFMMYLDTDELDEILSLSPLFSAKPWAIARFKRSDFHIDSNAQDNNIAPLPSVAESVRTTVEQQTGWRPTGPIRMLVNLRYWGYSINPLSTYYCFNESQQLVAIVAEVKNTPWRERHAYVLTGDNFSHKQRCHFAKKFHVSPFNPLNMHYQWQSTTPAKTLSIHLENWQDGQLCMDATMALHRQPITRKSLHKILIHFPFMTVKVAVAIYWQALKLFSKKVPVFNHPHNTKLNREEQ